MNLIICFITHHSLLFHTLTESRGLIGKYYVQIINLPSDWIEVVQLYQSIPHPDIALGTDCSSLIGLFKRKLDSLEVIISLCSVILSVRTGSLPTALRKAMIRKFKDFDEYQVISQGYYDIAITSSYLYTQLGKYNKDTKPKKKEETEKVKRVQSNKSDDEDELEKMTFTLKQVCAKSSNAALTQSNLSFFLSSSSFLQLIRKLHISEPVQSVMALIGKKYPATITEYYQSRLPGACASNLTVY